MPYPVSVAMGDGSKEALKHNSTQNDLPEELFYIRQDFQELFFEGLSSLKTMLFSASKKNYQ
jgi:hypothetical protein